MKGSGTFIEEDFKGMILVLLCSPAESHMTGREGSSGGPVAKGMEWTQESLLSWPQVTSCTSCCSEEEPKLPQVSSGPRGLSLKASLRKNPENIHERLDGSASAGFAPWVWSGETPHPTVLPRPPILGPGQQRKQISNTILLSNSIQMFLLRRNF